MKIPLFFRTRNLVHLMGHSASRHKGLWVTGVMAVGITFASCVSVDQVVMNPPKIKGATFVGTSECSLCHEDMVAKFEWSSHGRLMAPGDNAMNIGCESCHGPGSIHVESGGMPRTNVNPEKNPETCFQCHMDVRGSFHLPYGHSVMDGNMSCSDCHDPHEGNAVNGGGMSMMTSSQSCVECHRAQGDHYVFRHEASQDGCTVCHTPHGSVNNKMLKAANATLCLQCHFQQQTASGSIMIGERNHASYLPRGHCWSAGCHEAVHGSNISSSLRY